LPKVEASVFWSSFENFLFLKSVTLTIERLIVEGRGFDILTLFLNFFILKKRHGRPGAEATRPEF
jgi:hypothetical protein